jgi:arylsulfatase A-like enzyme
MGVSRREFLKGAAGGAVAAASVLSGRVGAASRPLNVVYIMTDQQPVSTLGCYGNPLSPTPNLDRLAQTGIRFTNSYIAGFPCSPSRACMITGRYPHSHGIETNDVLLGDEIPSMGLLLKASGRDTGYFGKWHLGGNMYRGLPGRGTDDGNWMYRRVPSDEGFRFETVPGGFGEDRPQLGFDAWVGGWEQYHAYLRDVGLGELLDKHPNLGNHNDLPSAPEGRHMFSQLPEEHHMDAFFCRRAEEFIRARRGLARPFALVVSLFGPHLPVAPPKPWDEKYSLEQCPLPANHFDRLEGKPIGQRTNRTCYMLPRWTDEQFQDYIRRYHGYCAYLDQQIGRVLAALTECGLDDSTIVIFTSDHGDMVGAHGMIYKLCQCGYEELMKVPLLMRVPGVTKPTTVTDALASNVDLMPTLLDLLGLRPDRGMQGVSLRRVLARPKASVRDAVFCDVCSGSLMVCDGEWKYVLHWRNRDVDELYHLPDDPGEMRNLATDAGHAKVVKEKRERICEWMRETGHPYAAAIEEKARQAPEVRLIDAEPEVTGFSYVGGNACEMTVTWHVRGPIGATEKYWCFTQFLDAQNQIAFRFTPWPEPPTTEWKAGNDYTVGPVRVEVPATAAAGKYQVRCGLWNPDTKKGPGVLVNGEGNAQVVGELTVKRQGETVTGIAYAPQKPLP